MILHMRVTQETKPISDHKDTMIFTGIIQFFSDTTHGQFVASTDTNQKPLISSDNIHKIFFSANSQQAFFSLQIDARVGTMNIDAPTHPCTALYVLHVAAHDIRLEIVSVLHH